MSTATTTPEAMVEALPAPIPPDVKPGYNKTFGRIVLALAALLIIGGLLMDGHKPTADEAAAGMISEFNADSYVAIPKLGPIDLSITKPVLYMWMAMLLCCAFAIWQASRMKPRPGRSQTFVETMYEFLHDQVAKSTLPHSLFKRYMPYLASVFLFIWVMNLISFLPLPLGAHSWAGEQGGPNIRDLGLYAATSNINVTITLTLVTIALTHYLGVREHGAIGYLRSWSPPGGTFLKVFMWLIHALGEFVKVVSLSVRLFANMLTGHMLILVMFTIIFVVGTTWVAFATVPVAAIFFLFEVGLIATLQAYIFAVLSGSYIGLATSHDH